MLNNRERVLNFGIWLARAELRAAERPALARLVPGVTLT
jgi:hypothetical protein